MSDIVERLTGTGAERQRTTAHDTPGHYLHVVAKISNADGRLMDEAADEITRLRAEVERLRAALKQIAGIDAWDDNEQGYVDKARAALGDTHERE